MSKLELNPTTGKLDLVETEVGNLSGETAGSILFTGSDLKVTEDNTNLFYDDTNNRLGIGTASPATKLDVESSDFVVGNFTRTLAGGGGVVTFTNGNDYVWGFGAGGDNHFSISDRITTNAPFRIEAGTPQDAFRIDSDGNVGIGTDSPTEQLEVVNNIKGARVITNVFRDATSGNNFLLISGTSPNQTLAIGNAGIKDITFGNSQYVGIGTVSPNEKLEVAGNIRATGLTASMPVWTDVNKTLVSKAITIDTPISLETYDPSPSRSSESDLHGGLQMLIMGQPLDSTPTNIVVTKGTGKVLISVNAGTDIVGDITITGTSVDRNTGVTTPADTDTITVDSLTTNTSTTDTNGNTKYSGSDIYISSKWFTGTVTLSTTNLTLTDVDVYHLSFEQFNDSPNITVETFDSSLYTTNVSAEYDSYLQSIEITGDKAIVSLLAELHIGADGETAIANKYWRLRRGNINKSLDGTTDGVWITTHYSNSPAYIEDVNTKVWAIKTVTAV